VSAGAAAEDNMVADLQTVHADAYLFDDAGPFMSEDN
jgi:hypothetical protein